MPIVAWLIFIAAAILEVCGDAIIRKGLRSRGVALMIVGFICLGCYGFVVNAVRWDFSKLLGVYVAVFAVISVLAARIVFAETISVGTWLGLLLIVLGGMTIQFARF